MELFMVWAWIAYCVTFVQVTNAVLYDTFTGRPVSRERGDELTRQNLIPWCAIEIPRCNPHEQRRMDGSCNNLKYPPRGALMTPYQRLLPPMHSSDYGLRTAKSGQPLPNARALRVALMSDGRLGSKLYTQLVTHFTVAITGDITSVHDTVNYVAVTLTCCQPGGEADPRCMPITVPPDDPHLRYSNVRCLNLTRAITYQRIGCAPLTLPPERVNTSPPMLELSILYGNDEPAARRSRSMQGGRLRSEQFRGSEWPPSGSLFCVNNEPPSETRCHNTAHAAFNSALGVNLLMLWMFRSHNYIARTLETMNPCWDEEKLFFTARDINIAYYQHIIYYELMPALLGYDYLIQSGVIYKINGHVNDYDDKLEPRVSIEYVIGTRWFHTMQEGRLKLYNRKGHLEKELALVDMTLRTGILALNHTLEGMTHGAYTQPSGNNDYVIDTDMGERVLGRLQLVSDVYASDLMKGRDAGLPPYNHYRALCGLQVAKTFRDLRNWMPEEQVDAIQLAYETVDDLELMAGIVAERPMPGAVMGPTLACIMTEQLLRWRRADRYWFENTAHAGAFNSEQLYEIRQISMARLICDYGEDVDTIQPYAFIVSGYGNERTSCKNLPAPRLDLWLDHTCGYNSTLDYNQMYADDKFIIGK